MVKTIHKFMNEITGELFNTPAKAILSEQESKRLLASPDDEDGDD